MITNGDKYMCSIMYSFISLQLLHFHLHCQHHLCFFLVA